MHKDLVKYQIPCTLVLFLFVSLLNVSLFLCKTWCMSKMLVHSMLWFLGTDKKSIKVITVRSFWMWDAKGNLIVLGNEFQS